MASVFLLESRDGKFGVLKFSVSREIYVEIPGNFFFRFKGFSGTDIYYSDVKMRSGKVSLKIFSP